MSISFQVCERCYEVAGSDHDCRLADMQAIVEAAMSVRDAAVPFRLPGQKRAWRVGDKQMAQLKQLVHEWREKEGLL